MYLHLGQDVIVCKEDIIGIFELDNCSSSHITRAFLKQAERAWQVVGVAEDIPKSFVLVQASEHSTIYLSQLSTATLKGRSTAVGFEH
ncbi:MAG: DUF370 domain-containing protein [Oscillospiraceae bacterium]|nr:DUF370 domain-containing protein [Oscillospiraceae bacterium]